MKRAIEFEETVKIRHQVIIECEYDKQINMVAELDGECFDDIRSRIADTGVRILVVNENYAEDIYSVEYYDDYWTKDEERVYGPSCTEADHETD